MTLFIFIFLYLQNESSDATSHLFAAHKAAQHEASMFPDYLVKWCGLPYSDCTIEDGELISRHYASAIEEYNLRNKSQRTPNPKYCSAMKKRPKFHALKEQPDYLGGHDNMKLRDYQMEGLNWLTHSWCRCVLSEIFFQHAVQHLYKDHN